MQFVFKELDHEEDIKTENYYRNTRRTIFCLVYVSSREDLQHNCLQHIIPSWLHVTLVLFSYSECSCCRHLCAYLWSQVLQRIIACSFLYGQWKSIYQDVSFGIPLLGLTFHIVTSVPCLLRDVRTLTLLSFLCFGVSCFQRE